MDGLMDGKIDRFIVRSGQVSQSFQGGWRVWGERRVGLVDALQYVVYPCILKVQTTSKRLKEWRTFCVYRCICWCMPMHADVWVLIIGHCWPKWCSISCRLTRPFSPCVFEDHDERLLRPLILGLAQWLHLAVLTAPPKKQRRLRQDVLQTPSLSTSCWGGCTRTAVSVSSVRLAAWQAVGQPKWHATCMIFQSEYVCEACEACEAWCFSWCFTWVVLLSLATTCQECVQCLRDVFQGTRNVLL